jgi:hypothetical protein
LTNKKLSNIISIWDNIYVNKLSQIYNFIKKFIKYKKRIGEKLNEPSKTLRLYTHTHTHTHTHTSILLIENNEKAIKIYSLIFNAINLRKSSKPIKI